MGVMPNRWCVIALIVTGCGDEAVPGPSTADFALAADGLASIDSEAAVVDAIELSLSGDFVFAPMIGEEALDALIRTTAAAKTVADDRLNDCLVPAPTFNGTVITWHLDGCLVDGHSVSGTVVSTWSMVDTVHVDHESDDLEIDGRAIRLASSVDGFLGEVETRRRTLTMEADGTFVLVGTWTATVEAGNCGTKTGSSTATFDGVVLERQDIGLVWCGDGVVDTLTEGRVELVRGASAVAVEFFGGDRVVLDGDNYTVDSTISELRD
jgi:hypothetical protein